MSKIALQGNASGAATFTLQPPATNTNRTLVLPDRDDTVATIGDILYPFRNKLINGNFDIWQRGNSQTTSGYDSADRWWCGNYGTTKTSWRQGFTLGQTSVPGNPRYFMRTSVTSVAGTLNNCRILQNIEGVHTLSGKTATLSFWAKADAPKNIAIEFLQNFGTGGTPSPDVTAIGSQLIALTTSWKKFEIIVNIPSISGKVLGTDNNDRLGLLIYFDAGSSYDARAANLGQQSGTFDIAQVQLEEGSVATPFEERPIETELALCQRYFCRVGFYGFGHATSTNSIRCAVAHTPVDMRNTPTLALINIATNNCSNPIVQWVGYYNTLGVYVTPSSAGVQMLFTAGCECEAEL